MGHARRSLSSCITTWIIPIAAILVSWTHVTAAYASGRDVIEFETIELTCWTCPNKTDNEACNNWAPDITCPHNHTVCKTVHRFYSRNGRSVYVSKVCAREHECTLDAVGCFRTGISGVVDCISCCDKPYCNELVPTNRSSALYLSSLTMPSSSAATSIRPIPASLVLPLTVFLWTMLSNASSWSALLYFLVHVCVLDTAYRTTTWRFTPPTVGVGIRIVQSVSSWCRHFCEKCGLVSL